MNNICSLKDCQQLKELILANPSLPLLVFAGEDAWQGEYHYNLTDVHGCRVDELTLYCDCWMDRDEFEEEITNDLWEEDPDFYKDMPDDEYDAAVAARIEETEFVKAIVMYVG